MKITIMNKLIVCTQEEFNKDFWYKVGLEAFRYSPFEKPKLMYEACIAPVDYDYKNDVVQAEYNKRILAYILSYADEYKIEVDESVRERQREINTIVKELHELENQMKERNEAQRHWKYMQQHGCGKCKYLCYDLDIPYCKATKKQLEERNLPNYDEHGVYQLYKYFKPIPSDDCIFKV